jgi:CSLREA domain-containing protein
MAGGSSKRVRGVLTLAALLVFPLVLTPPAEAAELTVNTLADTDGACVPAHCSLREAISKANADAVDDRIRFASDLGGEITLTGELPTITGPLEIAGPGPETVAISGDHNSRIVAIDTDEGELVELSGLTLRDGNSSGNGGALESHDADLTLRSLVVTDNVASQPDAGSDGGGLFSSGPLTIVGSTISANHAEGGQQLELPEADEPGRGGGVYSSGPLTIMHSTISGNGAGAAPGSGGGAAGGGVYSSGPLTIVSSTIAGNGAAGSSIGDNASDASHGGGVRSLGSLTVENSTIATNAAELGGAGGIAQGDHLAETPGEAQLTNTIVAANLEPDLSDLSGTGETHFELAFGLIGYSYSTTKETVPGTNLFGVDPRLGPLRDYGGPTETMALLGDSPAIDCGKSGGALTDQRGMTRPLDFPTIANASGGDSADIGAFELQGSSALSATCPTALSPPPPPPPPTDSEIMGEASASKTQRLKGKWKRLKAKRIRVAIKVQAAEELGVSATGNIKVNRTYKLKPKTIDVAANESRRLWLKPKRKAARRIVRALKSGKKVRARVMVALTDLAGNSKTEKLRVRLKR